MCFREFTSNGDKMTEQGESPESGGTFLSVVYWANIAVLAPIGFAIQLALFLATLPDKNRRIPGRFYRWMAIAASSTSPVWKFKVLKPLPAYRPSNTVVVCNHQSQADPFLISHLPWEMKWLSKRTVFFVPVIGWSIGLAGDIPVERGDRESAKKAMAKCASYLKRGMPVMIFPEGTRSRDGNLLPFKDGAFRLAIENGSDILPLGAVGTNQAFPKGTWKVGHAEAYVAMGEPISTQGMTLDDVEELKEKTRQAMQEILDRIRAEKGL